jgi:hypothetical protein
VASCRRRDGGRRDVCRWFSMSCSMASRRSCVKYVLWRRRDNWRRGAQRRFSGVVFSDILRLICAKYGVVFQRLVLWIPGFIHAIYGTLNGRHDRRGDAQRRFFQRFVLWLPSAYVYFVRNLESSTRRQASIC